MITAKALSKDGKLKYRTDDIAAISAMINAHFGEYIYVSYTPEKEVDYSSDLSKYFNDIIAPQAAIALGIKKQHAIRILEKMFAPVNDDVSIPIDSMTKGEQVEFITKVATHLSSKHSVILKPSDDI